MAIITSLYVAVSGVFIACALGLVWFGIKAYEATHKRSMIHLAIGFSLFVASAVTGLISTFLYGFDIAGWNMIVQNGITSAGMLVVLYSLITYP